MIDFQLNYRDLTYRDTPTRLTVYQTEDLNEIQESIDNFNKEISWDKMFDLNVALDRIKNGDKFFVAKYNEDLVGHCWLKERTDNEYYIYNVFTKRLPEIREYGATDMLYLVIKNNTTGMIYSEVDEWNEKSINMFKKLGFSIW